MMGLKSRIGGVWKPNKALSHRLLMTVAEEMINVEDEGTVCEDRSRWIVFMDSIVVS